MPKYTEKKKQKALNEIKNGKSQMKVAEQIGVPRSTVWGWMKKAGMVKSQKASKASKKSTAKKTSTKTKKKAKKSKSKSKK